MKASVSLPDALLDAAKEVWPQEKLSHVLQRALTLLLAQEGYVVEKVPARMIVHRPTAAAKFKVLAAEKGIEVSSLDDWVRVIKASAEGS